MILESARSKPVVFEQDVRSRAVEQISKFSQLQDGWCFGGGVAPSESKVCEALHIALMMEWHGWNTEAFPGESGEILLSGRIGDRLVEVILEESEDFAVTLVSGTVEVESRAFHSLHQVVAFLDELTPAPTWNIYDLFTPSGGAIERENLLTSLSSPQVRRAAAGFRLSIQHVRSGEAEQSARIFGNITEKTLPYQSSFGDSIATYFQVTR